MVELRHVHWVAAKHVLRHLCGTIGYGFRYVLGGEVRLQGYTDLDWAGNAEERKSTSVCCFNLGSTMISWFSRKQTFVALSTTQVEYIKTKFASQGAVCLWKLLAGLLIRS